MPRVIVIGLASCFGCQLQITNRERYLTDVLGQIDLRYWRMTSSEPLPESYDVAVIEGAVTTQESVDLVKDVRAHAKAVITIGACANTAGIPGIAADNFDERVSQVYQDLPAAAGHVISPRSVPDVIDVDFQVLCCPIEFDRFVEVLGEALYESNRVKPTRTLCGDCKRNERTCLYNQGKICLGMVTSAGCGARCPSLGRECNGCAGISPDANLDSARSIVERYGLSVDEFDRKLEMFNQTNDVLHPQDENQEA
jgi:coenzyme F420-reducing hydrogenase gamma subunit